MLSETAIHYLVGFLYLHTQRADPLVTVSAVLGEKVLDEAAEKKRDVDIVVASAGTTGFIGVEVKAEGRPIDIITVEQICIKLNDMPSFSQKYLVSTSGFTKPAIKKAAKHGLVCLHLVRGPISQFGAIGFEQLKTATVRNKFWVTNPPPQVVFEPDLVLDNKTQAKWVRSTPIRLQNGSNITTDKLTENLLNNVLNDPELVGLQPGFHPFNLYVNLGDKPIALLDSSEVVLSRAVIMGIIKQEEQLIPLEEIYSLNQMDGTTFGTAHVIIFQGRMFALLGNEHRTLSFITLPQSLLAVKPVRHSIGQQS